MADSCRPVSRHGRYNATGPSSVGYHRESVGYGNVDYTPSDEMYTENQPEVVQRIERPRTSRGRRSRAEMPHRPSSRRSGERQHVELEDEAYGRPASRVGFSPEASYRYSHDAYSRQGSGENERQLQNSPCSSPDSAHNDEPYSASPPHTYRIPPENAYRPPSTDRLIISPSNPGMGAAAHRQSPSHTYRQSPKHYQRPLSDDHMSVSPIQRDEPQIGEEDLHHQYHPHQQSEMYSEHNEGYQHEGEAYQRHFQDQPRYHSPYRESPGVGSPYADQPNAQYSTSPKYVMDSPYHREAGYLPAGSPESHRPPPAPRPKSARPKTARRKSARTRQSQRYQDQETSPPQQCDNTSILNSGDPYGRPSSSLSPYKPLPAIGVMAQQDAGDEEGHHHSIHSPLQSKVSQISDSTERLMLNDDNTFRPADNDVDAFSAEDIQGADIPSTFTIKSLPGVDVLTHLPRQLSNEIYNKSLADYDQATQADSYDQYDDYQDDYNEPDPSHSSQLSPDAKQDEDVYVSKSLEQYHPMPTEPLDGEDRIQLAVKLPDGKRVQRYFSPYNCLESALHFAENSSGMDYSQFCLVSSAPRKVFDDLSETFKDAGVPDRTVLYLEHKDL